MKAVKDSFKSIRLTRFIAFFIMTFAINVFSMKVSEIYKLAAQKKAMHAKFASSAISCLKNLIIKKYVKDRKGIVLASDVKSGRFSFDGKHFVSWGKDLILWNIDTQTPWKLRYLDYPKEKPYAAFSPDDKSFVFGGIGAVQDIILWNINNIISPVKLTKDDQSIVTSIAFSPDGTKLVAGSGSNLILWDMSSFEKIMSPKIFKGHTGAVTSIAFSPDSKKIVSGSKGNSNNLILWDISNINKIPSEFLEGHFDDVQKVMFSPNSKKILSASLNSLILYDITNERPTSKVLLKNKFKLIAFNVDGTKIISVSDNEKPILWNIENQDNPTSKVLSDFSELVTSVQFGFDGNNALVVYYSPNVGDSKLVLWDISNPNNLIYKILQVPVKKFIVDVVFSSDGTKIAVVDFNKQLILLSLVTDTEKLLLEGLKNYKLDQVKLIYDLCLRVQQGKSIALKQLNKKQNEMFNSLPSEMQKLLKDVLFTQTGFFSWFGW